MSKTVKHTPGPWCATEVHVQSAVKNDLIAAAPDLLEACKAMLTAHGAGTQPGRDDWDQVDAAIKRAEGQL